MQDLQPGIQKLTLTIADHHLAVLYEYHPEATDLILFLHGLACSHESFRYLLDRSRFPGVNLLVPDMLGFGMSAKPVEFSYTMEDQAELCLRLLRRFPYQRLHLVAHSMGGAVALLMTEQLAQLSSFANLEGNLISEDCGLLSRGIVRSSFDDYQKQGFADHQREFAGDPQLRFEQTTATAVYKSAQSLAGWSDSGKLLKIFTNLPGKTAYIFGEENARMPILRQLDSDQLLMIPDSGHGMMTDNPESFYTALAEFISS